MKLVDRAKNILLTPKTEWDAIAADTTPTKDLILTYVLPLAAVAAVAAFIGQVFVGVSAPLIGTVMLGNLMRESGCVERLKSAAENEITNIVTLLLGLCIGATMAADNFLRPQTLLVLALGFIAISLDTAVGVLFGKAMSFLTGGKINPLIGAAGISAFPMSARVVQVEGQKYNRKSYLLMHAMSANAGGQIGSVIAAAVMLSVLQGMGIVGG